MKCLYNNINTYHFIQFLHTHFFLIKKKKPTKYLSYEQLTICNGRSNTLVFTWSSKIELHSKKKKKN